MTSGNVQLGNLNSPGAITVSNTDNAIGATHGGIAVEGAVASSGGAISLTTGAQGTLSVASGDGVSTTGPAGTDVTVAGHTVTNAGSVTSIRDLIILADSLSNTGTMTTTRDLDVASFTAGSALSLASANGLTLTAGRDVNLGYNNASQITVTGLAISANNGAGNVSVNGGTNSVTLNDTSINGIIIGAGAGNLGGSSVAVTVSSGNVAMGNLSSTGAITVANTDNASGATHGGVSVVGSVASSGGAVSLTTGALGTLNVAAGDSVSTTGPGGTDITIAGHSVTHAGTISSNRDLIVLADSITGAGGTTATRDLDVASFTAGAPLTINGSSGLNMTAGRDVNLGFNNASQITVTGVAISANNGAGNVSLNGGPNAVVLNDTSINGVIIGAGAGSLGGSSVAVTVSSGNVMVGNLNSTGAITVKDNDNASGATHGNVFVVGAVASSGGAVSLTTGALGALNVATGDSVTTIPGGTDVTLAGHSVTNGGSVSSQRDLILLVDGLSNTGVMTTTRDLDVAGFTAGGALSLTSANGLALTAGRDINLGYNNAGQISVTGLALNANNGAGNVSINGGTHSVALNDTSIDGTIIGAGSANLGGSVVFVSVSSGNVQLGNLTVTGPVTVTNTDNASGAAHGNVSVTGNFASTGGIVDIASGNLGTVNVFANSAISGQTGVSIITPTLIVNSNGSVTAVTNNLAVQGSSGPLVIQLLSNTSALQALAGNISFNSSSAGSIAINSGLGIIAAGSSSDRVTFNGGNNNVTANLGAIVGCITGTSAQASFNTDLSSNNLMLGNFTSSSGNIAAVNTGLNGVVSICGNTSAAGNLDLTTASTGSVSLAAGASATGQTGVNVSAQSLSFGSGSSLVAATNDVTIISNGSSNALNVAFGSGSSIVATNGNITFGSTVPANQGAITVSGGAGAGNILSKGASPTVTFNGGTNPVSVSANEIDGCIHVTASSMAFQTYAGNLTFCLPISTESATGSGGNITIGAGGGSVMLNNVNSSGAGAGNSAGTISISGKDGVSFGTIDADGTGGASGGSVGISSRGVIVGQYINATGSGAGNGGTIATNSPNLELTGSSAGASLNASASGSGNGGAIIVTTTSSAPFTVGNGAVTGNGVLGNVIANGTSGGFITLDSYYAGQVVNTGAEVTANGTTGSGGKVLFEGGAPPNFNPVYAVINGLVQATNNANDSGIVGFNGGHGSVTLIGSGTINGGSVVRAGNLNSNTLEFLPHSGGLISVDPNLVITNNFETNGHGPIPTPPGPPGPTPPGPGPAPSPTPNSGGATMSTNAVKVTENSGPLLAAISVTESTSEQTAQIPSLTATDTTQIFGFANLDETASETSKLDYSKAEGDELIHGIRTSASQFDSREIGKLTRQGVKFGPDSKSNYCNIDVGNVIFSPKQDIVVGTHEAPIYIASGATVFVMENGHDVAIFDLNQNKPREVSVVLGNKRFTLEPGHMLVLSRQSTRKFDELAGEFKAIGYRNTKGYDINNIKAFVGEFSIPSAFTKVVPLKDMLTSNDQADQSTLQRIIKSAVILNDFGQASSSGNSPFRSGDMCR